MRGMSVRIDCICWGLRRCNCREIRPNYWKCCSCRLFWSHCHLQKWDLSLHGSKSAVLFDAPFSALSRPAEERRPSTHRWHLRWLNPICGGWTLRWSFRSRSARLRRCFRCRRSVGERLRLWTGVRRLWTAAAVSSVGWGCRRWTESAAPSALISNCFILTTAESSAAPLPPQLS